MFYIFIKKKDKLDNCLTILIYNLIIQISQVSTTAMHGDLMHLITLLQILHFFFFKPISLNIKTQPVSNI